ncbi:peptidase M23 [Micromonospora costi]|uniref:Peptidase M23 n=1 Tax=Micromonospora costi TaxID=1530042 RepID=A0A3A9ZVB6_9ACTN|nr:peptidase M23 [Micromonospora costi]RKN52121.1 peptidase M23 [Micromonospora costi]
MRNDGNLDDPNGPAGRADRSDDIPSADRSTSIPRSLVSLGSLLTRLAGRGNPLAARPGRTRVAVATGAVCCLGLVGVSVVGADPAGEPATPDQRAEIAQRAEADAASRGLAREPVAPVTGSPAPETSPSPTAKPTATATATAKRKARPTRIAPVAGLDQAQMDNAKTIVRTAQKMDVPRRAMVIAVATAMQESNLYNYASGVLPESQEYPHQAIGWDHDSVGLFQQRPSSGWGSVRDLMKPEYATRQFLTALEQIPGWQDLPLTDAAQAVQVSAFGWLYAQHEWRATEVVDAILA